jgi:hypothetical protein
MHGWLRRDDYLSSLVMALEFAPELDAFNIAPIALD